MTKEKNNLSVIQIQEKNILKENDWISVGSIISEKNNSEINPEIIIEIIPSKGKFLKRNLKTNKISEESFFFAQFSYNKFGE
jgi:hypothetical protein